MTSICHQIKHLQVFAEDGVQTFKLVVCLMLSSFQPGSEALQLILKINILCIYTLRLYT